MTTTATGHDLPRIVATPPGPRSRALASELRRHESRNITYVADDFPIFWRRAVGANVEDVDDNLYLDLTGGFGVAISGHRNAHVVAALTDQLGKLIHGLGDVHPPELKVRLLQRLTELAPLPSGRAILTTSGAEAVEAALKTARLASGRPGVLAFDGAYHGLTYGALAVTDGERFRGPFEGELGIPTARVPFPDPYRSELDGKHLVGATLERVEDRLRAGAGDRIGAVIVEPIQGRGGAVVPPDGFLAGLREICDRHDRLLILDEILTGLGRTGHWFACEHEGIEPDLICIGKGLAGGLPLSACVGRQAVMDAWPASDGEAIHTSTFLGHPLACAAALAQIQEIEARDLVARADRLGRRLRARSTTWADRSTTVGDVRGRGLLVGIEVVRDPESRRPDPDRARSVIVRLLRQGVLALAGGAAGNVLTLTPPITITEDQIDFAADVIEDCLARA